MNSKKITMILFFLLVVITSVSVCASSDCSEEISVLTNLGVVTDVIDYNTLETDTVSKGEALNLLLNIVYRDRSVDNNAIQVFPDVDSKNIYFKPIYFAYKLGIVSNDNGYEFMPNDPVTTEFFSKIAVKAIGFGYRAQKYNYSSSGYVRIAKELGIFDVQNNNDSVMSRKDLYIALYNLLKADSTVEYVSDDEYHSSTDSYTTVLERYFNYESVEGLCCANENTVLFGNITPIENEIVVMRDDGTLEKFKGDASIADYLGSHVKVYYEKFSGYNKSICVITDKDDSLTIDGNDFSYIDINDRKLYYDESVYVDTSRTDVFEKSVKIPQGIDIIYNGQYAYNPQQVIETLNNPGESTVDFVKLIDNNGDGKYDIMIADVYKNFCVKYVNTANKTITDRWQNVYNMDLNELDYKQVYKDQKGADLTFEKIAQGNVISIKEGAGGSPKLVTYTVSQIKNISARVIKIVKDDDKVIIDLALSESTSKGAGYTGSLVNGIDNYMEMVRYEVANNLIPYIDEILISPSQFYKFSIDKNGKIAGFADIDNTYSSLDKAVFLGVAKEDALKPKVKMRLFTRPVDERIWSIRYFDAAPEFKLYNIKESCLFAENPEAYYGDDVESFVLYQKLEKEYAKYGDDGEKYSSDVLKFIFGRKFATYTLNEKDQITSVTLPMVKRQDGQLAYYAQPNQEYYYKFGIFTNLKTGERALNSSVGTQIIVPDPKCSMDFDELCDIVSDDPTHLGEDITYKVDFYGFRDDNTTAEFSVRYINYDEIETRTSANDKNTTLGINVSGIVSRKVKQSSPYGYTVDAYYIYGAAIGGSLEWTPKKYVSYYQYTYQTPSKKMPDEEHGQIDGVSHTTAYSQSREYKYRNISECKPIYDIEDGDIVAFNVPYYPRIANSHDRFYSAIKLYDCSSGILSSYVPDESGDEEGDIDNGDTSTLSATKGKVFEVYEDKIAILPEKYYNPEKYFTYGTPEELEAQKNRIPTRSDCTLYNLTTGRVYVAEKLPNGGYNVRLADETDAHEAYALNEEVVVAGGIVVIYR